MHAAAASQQPERELARPRAAARPWPRSPTVAHPAHALRQSLAYPQVARVPTQQRLRLTAEKRAWPRASTDALPLRVKAEGFGYLHLRHDRGMPRKVRIPQSPPRMAQNSRRAPTFDPSKNFAVTPVVAFLEPKFAQEHDARAGFGHRARVQQPARSGGLRETAGCPRARTHP